MPERFFASGWQDVAENSRMKFLPRTPLAFAVLSIALPALFWWKGSNLDELRDTSPQSSESINSVARKGLQSTREARAIILSPHEGSEAIDEEIRRLQRRIAASPQPDIFIERLGRHFIAKARLSSDAGYYILAEQCAVCLEASDPDNADALLLRGHVQTALHRFTKAEAIGRRLITLRESELDHALLGDALMEQGRMEEAVPVYQRMADLKPCYQTYTRLAHLRWLKGDLEGAIEMMEQAVETGTPRDPEPIAWASTRLAAYQLQAANPELAKKLCDRALTLVPEYAPALLMQGRLLLAQDKPAEAVEALRKAATRTPLPEYQWILADALREAEQTDEAELVERQLRSRGAIEDPRTFSLYLSTRRQDATDGLRLAQGELKARQDVFTYDALAWAQFAEGRTIEAQSNMARALAEGTKDARLFLHAGLIAAACNRPEEARAHLEQASALRSMLLPSERRLLQQHSIASHGPSSGSPRQALYPRR